MVVEAIHYNANVLRHYSLPAKGITSERASPDFSVRLKGALRNANAMLALVGTPFWQQESERELAKIVSYIEENRVSAGLVSQVRDGRPGGPRHFG